MEKQIPPQYVSSEKEIEAWKLMMDSMVEFVDASSKLMNVVSRKSGSCKGLPMNSWNLQETTKKNMSEFIGATTVLIESINQKASISESLHRHSHSSAYKNGPLLQAHNLSEYHHHAAFQNLLNIQQKLFTERVYASEHKTDLIPDSTKHTSKQNPNVEPCNTNYSNVPKVTTNLVTPTKYPTTPKSAPVQHSESPVDTTGAVVMVSDKDTQKQELSLNQSIRKDTNCQKTNLTQTDVAEPTGLSAPPTVFVVPTPTKESNKEETLLEQDTVVRSRTLPASDDKLVVLVPAKDKNAKKPVVDQSILVRKEPSVDTSNIIVISPIKDPSNHKKFKPGIVHHYCPSHRKKLNSAECNILVRVPKIEAIIQTDVLKTLSNYTCFAEYKNSFTMPASVMCLRNPKYGLKIFTTEKILQTTLMANHPQHQFKTGHSLGNKSTTYDGCRHKKKAKKTLGCSANMFLHAETITDPLIQTCGIQCKI